MAEPARRSGQAPVKTAGARTRRRSLVGLAIRVLLVLLLAAVAYFWYLGMEASIGLSTGAPVTRLSTPRSGQIPAQGQQIHCGA